MEKRIKQENEKTIKQRKLGLKDENMRNKFEWWNSPRLCQLLSIGKTQNDVWENEVGLSHSNLAKSLSLGENHSIHQHLKKILFSL